jgi:hypothetical protein
LLWGNHIELGSNSTGYHPAFRFERWHIPILLPGAVKGIPVGVDVNIKLPAIGVAKECLNKSDSGFNLTLIFGEVLLIGSLIVNGLALCIDLSPTLT